MKLVNNNKGHTKTVLNFIHELFDVDKEVLEKITNTSMWVVLPASLESEHSFSATNLCNIQESSCMTLPETAITFSIFRIHIIIINRMDMNVNSRLFSD